MSAVYPDSPGFKCAGTSQEAAEGIAPKAQKDRAKVLAALQQAPGSPEQIAERTGLPLMNVRPRCSELGGKGLIRKTSQRGPAMGGRKATVWEAV